MGIEYSAPIAASADAVWQWLSRPGAVQRLLPPWQPITVSREADSLADGVARLRVAGLPWVARHRPDQFLQGRRFVDELESAPWRAALRWRHEHLVDPTGPDACTVTDRVQTPVPERLLRSTFAYRSRQMSDDLAAHRRFSPEPLTFAVSGSSGLIGRRLRALLSTGGHRVIALVRRPANTPDERRWDPRRPADDLLAGVDVVVHLAGASIAGRFTAGHKRRIRESRVGPTALLAAAAAAAGVSTFVSASAIGFYGPDRGDAELAETAARGTGFLADVVGDWEADAAGVADRMRVVTMRTGIVLTPDGGYLRPLRPLFAAGVGGRLGTGRQWVSWIGIDDLLEIYLRAATDPVLAGPVNAVAPNPVRGAEFAAVLGRVMRRPSFVPTPGLGPRLLLGTEGAAELVAASQRVRPAVLLAAGHRFRFVELADALRHLLGRAA